MLALVDTLMEYHRMDEGGTHSKNTLFSLKTLFEEIADSHRLAARQKKLAFTASFSGLDVMVNCDSSHIRQIVGNLLSNALKFTFHGKVLLEVEYRPGNLHISVLDTGMGIGLEEKKRIFGAFERLDNARNIPGFGLGLAITARLVSLMQGHVEVESVPGEGSRFSVFLPMLPAGHPVCPEEKFSPVCELPVDIRVLVIDDNRIQLGVISKMLSRNQIHCDCCSDVRELMDCLNKQKYDLLLTDIQMPGTNGFLVLELLRTSNIPRAWEIPVIAITARSDKKGEYLTAGFADCLYKPFSEEELLAAVSQMDRPAFAAIMEGEENVEEMLDLFIKDTMGELAGIRDAFSTGDYKKLGSIIHKAAPLWEMIRINIPQSELREMASMPSEKWGGLSDERIEELIKAVEHAVEKAKRIKKRVYGTVLIVEDDRVYARATTNWLVKNGINARYVLSVDNAKEFLDNHDVDLVLSDFRLDNGNGMELLEWMNTHGYRIPFLIMTGYGIYPVPWKRLKKGAVDYLPKPVQTEKVLGIIRKALERKRRDGNTKQRFYTSKSPLALRLQEHIRLVAPVDTLAVLIRGASGTGKEYVARQIHVLSGRSDASFIAVDCGVLPKELAASELFGHVKGAFTGATENKTGMFAAANHGTLFLDEVGNLNAEVQRALLRALQEKRYRPVGGKEEIQTDIRLVAATNEDLEKAIAKDVSGKTCSIV